MSSTSEELAQLFAAQQRDGAIHGRLLAQWTRELEAVDLAAADRTEQLVYAVLGRIRARSARIARIAEGVAA